MKPEVMKGTPVDYSPPSYLVSGLRELVMRAVSLRNKDPSTARRHNCDIYK